MSATGQPFSRDFCALLTAMLETDADRRVTVREAAVRAAELLAALDARVTGEGRRTDRL